MALKAYSLARDGALHLTPHFRVREFACRDGADLVKIDTDLVELLERQGGQVRQAAQAVSSGFTDDIRANVEQMMVPKELEHVQKS